MLSYIYIYIREELIVSLESNSNFIEVLYNIRHD